MVSATGGNADPIALLGIFGFTFLLQFVSVVAWTLHFKAKAAQPAQERKAKRLATFAMIALGLSVLTLLCGVVVLVEILK